MGASEGDADLYADVARGLVKECEEHDVRFDRGDLFEFLLQLSPIHEALTVVDPDSIDRVTSLQIKSLFSLWIVVVDDEMDVHGGHSELHASMAWLTGVLTGSGAPQPGRGTKGAVFLLERLRELLMARHGMDARISLDVLQCVAGFYYEAIANRQLGIANSREFMRLSTLTTGVMFYVDVDLVLSGRRLPPSVQRTVRAACDGFADVLKLAFDIGSLRRDLFRERNQSYITLRAVEGHEGLDLTRLVAGDEGHESFVREIEHARRRVQSDFADAVRLLTSVQDELSVSRIIGAVGSMMKRETDWRPD